jgi:hypothetical protein
MSTVKISQLPLIAQINANTSNTLFAGVDVPTGVTGKMTAHTLAQGLYSNEILNVGANPVLFSNTVSQFSGSDPQFLQINLQNFNANGSSDYIITGDQGTNSNNYIDLGLNGSNFQTNPTIGSAFLPNDGYLYVQGPGANYQGNLTLGTASSNTHVNFIIGGANAQNVVAKMTTTGLVLNTQSSLTFSDGSVQNTAAVPVAYSQASFGLSNTNLGSINTLNSEIYNLQGNVSTLQTSVLTLNTNVTSSQANTITTQGVDATQNTNIQSAWNLANTSIQNTANILLTSNVTSNGVFTFNGLIVSNGGRISNGNTTFNGNNITNGSSVFNGNVTSNGTSSFNGPIILNGNTQLNCNLITTGTVIVGGTITPSNNNISLGTANNPFNSIYVSNNGVTLSNSSLSLSGTLNVAGNSLLTGTLTANGQSDFNGLVIIQNQTYSQNTGALEIIGSSSGLMVPPAANGYMIHVTGLDGVSSKISTDNFGPGNTYALYTGRSGRGTAASPTSTQSGDIIARYSSSGYTPSGFNALGTGRIEFQALENFSNTAQGSQINFATIPVGSNVLSTVVTVGSNVVNILSNTTLKVANTIQYDSSVNNGTVTQLTSKSTAVTLNGRTGQITTNNATLNKGVAVQFTVNNNFIVSAKDVVIVNIASGASVGYDISINSVTPGSFIVNLHNSDSTGSGSNASDTLVINFAIIRVA